MDGTIDDLKTGIIAFSASLGRHELPWTLILLDLKTGKLRYLHDYSNGSTAVAPLWSPNGRYLLYSFNKNCHGVCIYDLEEDRFQRIDQSGIETGDCQASWSPDSHYIVYQRHRYSALNDRFGLAIYDLESGEHRQLTHHAEMYPTWSSDGEWINYYAPNRNAGHYRIRLDGSDEHPFFEAPEAQFRVRRIDWSADGTKSLFSAWIWADGNTKAADWGGHQAYIANADGSHARLLTQDIWHNCQPLWSPKNEIALLANHEEIYGASKIYLFKDGTLREVVSQTYDDYDRWNFWSPSGDYIAYTPFHGRTFEGRGISILKTETGEVQEFVPDLMAAYPVWKPTNKS